MKIFECEESVDGIFTAIYQAWSSKLGHHNVKIKEKWKNNSCDNLELFSEYIMVETDYELSSKVANSIRTKISQEAYQMVYYVALSNYEGKADLIYRFLILGFAMGRNVINHLSNDVVCTMMKVSKYVGRESHYFLGFVRFTEEENGLLISVIHPKNHVLPIITPHFADRLANESFLIYDENRGIASVHAAGNSWTLLELSNDEKEYLLSVSKSKDNYSKLWKIFFETIAIKERTNYKLQRNMLPKRFRSDMHEFQEDII